MDFPRWIRNFSKKYKNRDFQSEIQKERKQKYLFRDDGSQLPIKRGGIFREKKRALKPFTNFFQETIFHRTSAIFGDHKILGNIGLLLIFLCIYIVAFSPFFQISPSKVLIEGVNDGIDINIAYRSIEDVYTQNLFFFDEEKLALNLKKYQNNIEKVSIHQLYPNGLKIILESYPILYRANIPSRSGKSWGLTANGVLIPINPEKLEGKTIFDIIINVSEDELLDYKNIITETRLLAITKVISIFSEEWPDIKLGRIKYLSEENELHLTLENGGKVLFALQDFSINTKEQDLYKNLKEQIVTLKAYIEKNHSVLTGDGLIYIDVRIPGKIFVCRVKDSCLKNLGLIYGEDYQ